jgi:predicted lipoprotein with Yx(FWY)xxD motif
VIRTSQWALAGMFPLTAFLVAACGSATSAIPGAAYGTSPATVSASAQASASASASAAPMNSAKTALTVRKTKIGYVLANATGRTVYWYGHDMKGSGKSSCTGACLSAWPAVTGMPTAAPGVKLSGKLSSITRPGGVVQATYNGYPLYTYAADMAPGDTTGNGVGGQWHVIVGMTLSPSPASAAAASTRDISAKTKATQPGASPSAMSSGMMSPYNGY